MNEQMISPCPVPWCRGEADADWYAVGEQDHPYWVRCKSCGCKTPTQYATVAEAIAAWNTRAYNPDDRLREALDEMGAALAALVNSIEVRPYRSEKAAADTLRAHSCATDVLIKYGFGV